MVFSFPFGDAPTIAREVTALLRDDNRRHAIRKDAYRCGRESVLEQRDEDVHALFRMSSAWTQHRRPRKFLAFQNHSIKTA